MAFLLGCLPACSAATSWDAELPCGPEGAAERCAPGHSCLTDEVVAQPRCVFDGGQKLRQACATDAQCAADLVCYGHRCERACALDANAAENFGCAAGELCEPTGNGDRGACIAAVTCQPGALCSAPGLPGVGVCVAADIRGAAATCFAACLPGMQFADAPALQCPADFYCTLLGQRAPQAVCLPAAGPLPEGTPCDAAAGQGCATSQTCVTGRCLQQCSSDTESTGAAVCPANRACLALALAPAAGLPRQLGYCEL